MMGLEHYACKRAYLSNDKLIKFLEKDKRVKYVGLARFKDHILRYSKQSNHDTDKNLLWCREIKENVWPTMKVGKFYPFFKQNSHFESGFQFFEMPIGAPLTAFNKLKDSMEAFGDRTEEWFAFERTTREYLFEDISIYVEDIEKVGITVEFVCKNESNSLQENMAKVDKLMKEYGVSKVIPHQVATLVKTKLRI